MGEVSQVHCLGLEYRLTSEFYLDTSCSLRVWCLAAQSPTQDRWSWNPQGVSDRGHFSRGPSGKPRSFLQKVHSPLLRKTALAGSCAGDSPVGANGWGADRVEGGLLSVCLPLLPCQLQNNSRRAQPRAFSTLGREGGNVVEGEEGPSCEATPPQSFWPHMPSKLSSGLAQVSPRSLDSRTPAFPALHLVARSSSPAGSSPFS